MVRREVQRRERRFRIEYTSHARVVALRRAGRRELRGVEDDVVLGVPVGVGVQACRAAAHSLVELWLQIRPRVERRAALQRRLRGAPSPALGEAPPRAGVGELPGAELLAGRRHRVGVGVQAKDEAQLWLPTGFPRGADSLKHRERHEPVGVTMEGGQQEGRRVPAAGRRPDDRGIKVACSQTRGARVGHAFCRFCSHLLYAVAKEAASGDQHQAVLVALRVQVRGHQDMICSTENRRATQSSCECSSAFLQENHISLRVLLLKNLDGEPDLVLA
mmetsp:Transcript_41523/g.120166  ORF Transcript_41523/g.120166 Transcript_41523/m.120166 type:complete len:275 (+) Transcript_41523:75-899(+)